MQRRCARRASYTKIAPCFYYPFLPWQFLYFFPEPQGQGSFRPIFGIVRRTVTDCPCVCFCIAPPAAALRAASPLICMEASRCASPDAPPAKDAASECCALISRELILLRASAAAGESWMRTLNTRDITVVRIESIISSKILKPSILYSVSGFLLP